MSFDLAVFLPAKPLAPAAATKLYARLCDAPGVPAELRDLPAAFYKSLVAEFPELDDDDDSPWSATLDRGKRHVVMPIVFSRADEVAARVKQLAGELGLSVYDPQRSVLLSPAAALREAATYKPAKSRSKKISPQNQLADALAPAMAKRDFDRIPGRPWFEHGRFRYGFRNTIDWNAVIQIEIVIDDLADVLEPHRHVLETRFADRPRFPAIACDALDLYRDPDGKIRNYGDVHRKLDEYDCRKQLGRIAGNAARTFDAHIAPLYRRYGTLRKLDALYHGDPDAILCRYSHEWHAHAFIGTAVAHLSRRRDRKTLTAGYRTLIASVLSRRWMTATRLATLREFDAMVDGF